MTFQNFFVVDIIGHVVEKDNMRETEKSGRKSIVIDLYHRRSRERKKKKNY